MIKNDQRKLVRGAVALLFRLRLPHWSWIDCFMAADEFMKELEK